MEYDDSAFSVSFPFGYQIVFAFISIFHSITTDSSKPGTKP
jgi:hypothetical protein